MKIMNMFRVIMVSCLAIFVSHASFARPTAGVKSAQASAVEVQMPIVPGSNEITIDQQKELAQTFVETERIVKSSTEAIDAARDALLNVKNEDAQNVQIIIDHNKAKVLAEQKLATLSNVMAKKVDAVIGSESYARQLIDGVKNMGSGIALYFAPGTGTYEEKETARQISKGLEAQEVKITEKYALLQKDLASSEQAEIKSRYEAIITQLEGALYEQQLITGDTRMGMIKRSLLLGAAAAGTAAVGMLVKNKYFGETSENISIEDGLTQETPLSPETLVTPEVVRTTRTQQDSDEYREKMQQLMKEDAQKNSVPYKIVNEIKEVSGKVYDAAERGVSKVINAFNDREETPENTTEYGMEELGTQLRTTIPAKIEEGKQALIEAYESIPAKIEEGKQAVTEAYRKARDSEVGTTIAQKIEEGKELSRRFIDAAVNPSVQTPGEEDGFVDRDYEKGFEYLNEKGEEGAQLANDFIDAAGNPSVQTPGEEDGFVDRDYKKGFGYLNEKGREGTQLANDFIDAAVNPSVQTPGEEDGFVDRDYEETLKSLRESNAGDDGAKKLDESSEETIPAPSEYI